MDDVVLDGLSQHGAESEPLHVLGDHGSGSGGEGLIEPVVPHAEGQQQVRAIRSVLGDLTKPLEGENRALHVVDDHDVRFQLLEVPPRRVTTIDEAGNLEAGGLPQGQSDGVGDEGVVRHDEHAFHDSFLSV
jgi:hypothetical protein